MFMQEMHKVTVTLQGERGLTSSKLMNEFEYSQATGLFTRKSTGRVYDKPTSSGYVMISVGGRTYQAQNLAWLYVHGELPVLMVDHIDRNRSNNKISNLRLATGRENAQNKSVSLRSKSGVKGVHEIKSRGIWCAEIYVDGKRKRLGFFRCFDEAVSARRSAELLHHSHSQEALK
jgi:hypothetical protein